MNIIYVHLICRFFVLVYIFNPLRLLPPAPTVEIRKMCIYSEYTEYMKSQDEML